MEGEERNQRNIFSERMDEERVEESLIGEEEGRVNRETAEIVDKVNLTKHTEAVVEKRVGEGEVCGREVRKRMTEDNSDDFWIGVRKHKEAPGMKEASVSLGRKENTILSKKQKGLQTQDRSFEGEAEYRGSNDGSLSSNDGTMLEEEWIKRFNMENINRKGGRISKENKRKNEKEVIVMNGPVLIKNPKKSKLKGRKMSSRGSADKKVESEEEDISNEDILNSHKQFWKEVRARWDMRKKLGLSCIGDEDGMVKRLIELDEKEVKAKNMNKKESEK